MRDAKKGQVTIFIIAGVVIALLVVGAFFIFKRDVKIFGSSADEEIVNFVDSCLEESLIKSFYRFGLQADNYVNDSDFGNSIFINLTYYYYEGEDRLPSIEDIEESLESWSQDYFDECIDSFESFEERGIEIEDEEKKIDVKIKEREVEIVLDYPLIVRREEKTTNFKDFKKEIDFNFFKVHKILSEFILEQKIDSNSIPIGYIGLISNEEDLIIQYSTFPDDAVLYYFSFNDVFLAGEPYQLYFMIKYDWSEIEEVRDVEDLL